MEATSRVAIIVKSEISPVPYQLEQKNSPLIPAVLQLHGQGSFEGRDREVQCAKEGYEHGCYADITGHSRAPTPAAAFRCLDLFV